jgi:hypothetical protein
MRCARLAVLFALAVVPAAAGADRAPPCDARFLVQGEPLLGDSPEAIDVNEDGVSILDLCGEKKARVRITPEGARVRVRFSTFCPPGRLCGASFPPVVGPRWISSCDGMRGVRLQAAIDPSCQTLTGRLRSRRPRIDREFVATVSPLAPAECVPNVEGEDCLCGTMFLLACPESAFCDPSPGLCLYSDIGGECMPIPEDCPDVSQPVCGCDGVSYDNDCARRAAAVSKAHDGACESPE